VNEQPARDDVLFVLKVPPPFGGGEIEHQYIYEELRNDYHFLVFARKVHSKASQGKIKLANILFGLGMILKIVFFCLRKKPTIIFLWLPKDYPAFIRTVAIVWIMRMLRIKVIGDLHGMGFSFLGSKRRQAMFEKQINNFYAIRTLSLSISNDLRSCGFNNIIVPVDNGVRVPEFILKTNRQLRRPLRLLYLGAISDSKGFIRVLHLLTALRNQNILCHLNVVGEWTSGDFKQHANEFISQNKLSSLINFAGILNDEPKWRAIEESHFLVHFSEWDGQPLTIIEAMAAGVPTLAHSVGGIPEMIKDHENGFLVNNSRQAAEILGRIVEGEIDYSVLSQEAKKTFNKRFTIQRYIENIEKLVLVNKHVTSDTISKNW
jgi:glycosyltransferase involved in cell wall biosynthesis